LVPPPPFFSYYPRSWAHAITESFAGNSGGGIRIVGRQTFARGLPVLLAAPADVVALNYFFDTLLFCGAILLLANAMEKETTVPADSMRIKTRTD